MPISSRIVSALASMISTASLFSSSTVGMRRRMYGSFSAARCERAARRVSRLLVRPGRLIVDVSLKGALAFVSGRRPSCVDI